MRFKTPGPNPVAFDIPDDWWAFADMPGFERRSDFYPPAAGEAFELVQLAQVEPPRREAGLPPFRKYKLLPVLFAFQSPECALPLVQLERAPQPGAYTYRVHNGFHRFYASAAAGFPRLPAVILSDD